MQIARRPILQRLPLSTIFLTTSLRATGPTKMFAQVIVPTYPGRDELRFLWVVHKAVEKLKSDLCLICPSGYWRDVDRIVEEVRSAPPSNYDYLKSRDLSQKLVNTLFRRSVTWPLPDELCTAESAWVHRITQEISDVAKQISDILRSFQNTEAILTWTNCATLRCVSRDLGIRLIHNEVGPLRPPHYKATGYFDFAGVGQSTGAIARWVRFRDERANVPLHSLPELAEMFLSSTSPKPKEVTHHVGVSLQDAEQEDLSGISNAKLIELVRKNFEGPILCRLHPAQDTALEIDDVDLDNSISSIEFISKVEVLVTVNSGIGVEAMLHGKRVYSLGDPPYKYNSCNLGTKSANLGDAESLEWVNWFLFCYLIPFERLFDSAYYRWRLGDPPESEIYFDNYRHWHR
ncbi:GT99 family glycosyltransferase N-terminal domain-containing protein [Methylobacterium brachiatum]|uniref:GT99 family glycosyltransferase N-terminal domain-containing protein n=1 Tax=Methylobacterium brachiatum TaxID=269660 RepID=UPI0013CEF643|nr:hypothetical protein [Methylobacterium brachiatum]